MKYRIDLHCHSRFSADGVSEPEEMVRAAKERGLHGFAITDHNTCACVDYFISIGLMREDGHPVDGFLIIPGQEITTSAGHLIALGVRLPDLKGIEPAEAMGLIHSSGGLAVPPHPYDNFRAGIRESVLDGLALEAIEVFNAAVTFKRANRRAYDYATKRDLAMTAGSDAHHVEAIGTACTLLEMHELTTKATLASIRHGAAGLEQRYMSRTMALRKTWNNVFRLRSRVKRHSPHPHP
ncbi:MAG: CehA/McbA family metallohydrolase [Verrucomicrobia bacterium]|nr:CehA/McbA family metallohydrolase [Verrucomicrobiota bacterium]